ncbi:MAG: RluA family pseudouridine synthase [Gammaproteobacteria bacterium]|nr:RluA family pseudouridine synthase [Gammaproteobacteria bacterium]
MITSACKDPIDKFEKHLNVLNDNTTAIDLLAEHTDFSRQKIKQIMQKGAVWLTQGKSTRRIRRASKKLSPGQTLHLYYDAHILAQSDFEARLIADETDYSVWFKPSGMLSQGSKFGDHGAIYRWAETHLQPQRNAFLVHRLDRATSGLMLIAHSKKAAAALSAMFKERAIDKYYKALVHGTPHAPQTLNEPLENKRAITKILSVEKNADKNTSLLDIQILTGRKHQIRQHLSIIGHPIVGDRLYGDGKNDNIDLCLTAYKIAFISPFEQQADKQKKHYELGNEYYNY